MSDEMKLCIIGLIVGWVVVKVSLESSADWRGMPATWAALLWAAWWIGFIATVCYAVWRLA